MSSNSTQVGSPTTRIPVLLTSKETAKYLKVSSSWLAKAPRAFGSEVFGLPGLLMQLVDYARERTGTRNMVATGRTEQAVELCNPSLGAPCTVAHERDDGVSYEV